MANGRDLAAFITKHTGMDYVGLYDAAEEQDRMNVENTKKNFDNIMERIKKSDKMSFVDKLD